MAVRLVMFLGVLVLTLLPGLVAGGLPVELDGALALLGYAWLWQILATLPVGIARIPFDGQLYFENTSELVALGFWLLVGLGTAVTLRRLRPAYYAAASLIVILGSGLGAHLLLAACGYAMYMAP
jgi:hypothetical protein